MQREPVCSCDRIALPCRQRGEDSLTIKTEALQLRQRLAIHLQQRKESTMQQQRNTQHAI
jgi:hypothetical protein